MVETENLYSLKILTIQCLEFGWERMYIQPLFV